MSTIIYEFKLEDGSMHRFEVHLSSPSGESPKKTAEHRSAGWTALGYHQCANCPLSEKEHQHCPVALDIEDVAAKFSDILSYETADIRVLSDQRNYEKTCDVQNGLKSLMGLIMASGECPILSQFKPMAVYHLPFATVEETIYRVAGLYLIKQYFLHKSGEATDLDLEGLNALYGELQLVNKDFMKRIRAASASDANLNAINNFLSLSTVVAATLQEKLEEIRPLFFRDPEPAQTNK